MSTAKKGEIMKKFKSKYRSVKRDDDKLDLLLPCCHKCNLVLNWQGDNNFDCELCSQKYITSPKVIRVNNKITGFCNDCGRGLDYEQDEESINYQIEHMANPHVRVSCNECVDGGHTLIDKEIIKIEKNKKTTLSV